MGENSGIQWTTHTFNPWVGCQRVSPGCENCYAEAYDKRVGGVPKSQREDPEVRETRWGPNGRRTVTKTWGDVKRWNARAKVLGVRERVFCASLADVFEDRPDLSKPRADLWNLIAECQQLDFLLLTKRPENIKRMLPAFSKDLAAPLEPWPNIWLGTTVEDQRRANERIPHLLAAPAVVRFLSCEPLLESVDLRLVTKTFERSDGVLACDHCCTKMYTQDGPCPEHALRENCGHCRGTGLARTIDWVIIGGESGSEARPFNVAWARSLVEQCRAAGVAPFVKQFGAVPTTSNPDDKRHAGDMNLPSPFVLGLKDSHGGDMSEWPEDLRVREFPEETRP